MAYRFTATGTLDVPARNVDAVCNILACKHIRYEREGTQVRIKHDERASTPANVKAEEAFEDLAPYLEKPQALVIFSDLNGEYEVGFVDGRLRTDEAMHIWSSEEKVPTPDEIVDGLKERGIASRVVKVRGSRKSGRRSRVFEVQPGSGGPSCRVTIKRRFWDSYDLLSVPEVYEPLCRKYHLPPLVLRDRLRNAKFGVEVRNPALGNASSDMLFDAILDIVEELVEGIRTDLG